MAKRGSPWEIVFKATLSLIKCMKAAIIGGGNMGSIFAQALCGKKMLAPEDLLFVEAREERCEELRRTFGCRAFVRPDESLAECEVVILAVKPQDASCACAKMSSYIRSAQIVLSIMAGITLQQLAGWLPSAAALVRCMPNLPTKIGEGVSVFFPSPRVAPQQKTKIQEILECLGLALPVSEESLIDAATAVSGSGPGYLFYIIENYAAAAEKLGFSAEQAKNLIYQTIRGSIEMWRAGSLAPAELRAMITSKGGTTAAAVSRFEEGKLGQVLQIGIHAAFSRAKELASGK